MIGAGYDNVYLMGLIFATVKAVVTRQGALSWRYLTGHWPGETRPEPD